MSIYENLLARGFFPKELPPSFYPEVFAKYATTKNGRKVLTAYAPPGKFTECVTYRLALPGSNRRDLGIPHPASFSILASVTAKGFRRLLRKAGESSFSKSRPVYTVGQARVIRTLFKPASLPRERSVARAGGTYLVKADVNHFYPSLYTHAIAWAIDPKSKLKANWHNKKLLGNKLDLAVRDLQRKVSQGIPIGNDISFLLAEVVLAQVDHALGIPADRAYRWVDDYEITCDSLESAENVVSRLSTELGKFRLRLNATKTRIVPLPVPAQDEWQQTLIAASRGLYRRPDAFVSYFDIAFRLRVSNPQSTVLSYALGLLFRLPKPDAQVAAVVQSGVTQSLWESLG